MHEKTSCLAGGANRRHARKEQNRGARRGTPWHALCRGRVPLGFCAVVLSVLAAGAVRAGEEDDLLDRERRADRTVPERVEGAVVPWGEGGTDPKGLGEAVALDRATPEGMRAMKRCAAGRKGYVVWESRRPSGTEILKYRIWKRNLDGTGLAMISGYAERGGYSHIAPRVSPDGRYVVFAGKAWNGYKDKRVRNLHGGEYAASPFDAWIVEMDPETLQPVGVRELTDLRGRVGGAGEDHVFEWKDAETLYVPLLKQSAVYEVNARTGDIGRKVVSIRGEKTVGPGGAYVLCAQGGGAGYAPIERDEQGNARVGRFRKLGGCQANISVDNDLVLWVRRPGNLSVLDLDTGKSRNMRKVRDALPRPHNYIYFPALVRDMSYIVLAGGDEHSHAYADYEIFLVPWDKEANTSMGPPVRYTFNDRNAYKGVDRQAGHVMDRWPHAWVYNPRFSSVRMPADPTSGVRGDGAAPKVGADAVTATVVATIARRSTPLEVAEVAPYTEALVCTEYEVEKVVDGTFEKGRILTVQLAMSDGKQLAPATFREGDTYRLTLGGWEAQPHYHSHPMAQDILDLGNLDAELYFIFEATKMDEP